MTPGFKEDDSKSIEGIVVRSTTKSNLFPSLILSINTMENAQESPAVTTLVIPHCAVRINVGERVRAYSNNNFRWPNKILSNTGYANHFEILSDDGKIKYEFLSR